MRISDWSSDVCSSDLALAVAQVQSVAGSGLGAIGYAVQGGIDWPMAIFVAVPQMVGVVVGWKVARAVPARSLAFVLAFVLIGLEIGSASCRERVCPYV